MSYGEWMLVSFWYWFPTVMALPLLLIFSSILVRVMIKDTFKGVKLEQRHASPPSSEMFLITKGRYGDAHTTTKIYSQILKAAERVVTMGEEHTAVHEAAKYFLRDVFESFTPVRDKGEPEEGYDEDEE